MKLRIQKKEERMRDVERYTESHSAFSVILQRASHRV